MKHQDLEAKIKVLVEFVKKFLIPRQERRMVSSAKETFLRKVIFDRVHLSLPKLFVKYILHIKYGELNQNLSYGGLITYFLLFLNHPLTKD